MKKDVLDKLSWWAGIGLASIVLLVPFHAVLTTWAGSNFGHLDLFRIWKELLCVPIGLVCVARLWQKPSLRRKVCGSPIFWLALIYSLFTVATGLMALKAGTVNSNALVYSLLINPRLAVFLVLSWIIALDNPWLPKHWRELLLGPALLVVSFGILQRLVLPKDILRHLGYGANTIPAVQTIDQQVDFRRIQSTLRGANPLGAYLVLIITALVGVVIRKKQQREFGAFLVTAAVAVLIITYSRSAYLGAVVSVAFLVWQLVPHALWRRRLLVAGCVSALALSIGVVLLRNNDMVQNTVFHTSEASRSAESSNASRANALKQGVREVVAQPFGRGPGTAGPASFRNNHPPRIAENYYIQLAQEVGIIGLGLFMAMNIVVGAELWRRRADLLPLALLASLIGLTCVNLISHAWTDDTLSVLWWSLAGIALANPSAPKKAKAKAEIRA
jgi:hypothetical protein